MAKATSSVAFVFILSLLIVSISVESRFLFGGFIGVKPRLQCNTVHGVKSGDTCFAIAQTFHLTTAGFNFINPNLNCSDLFVGQWLCIDGSLS